ncbi:hypothetical protein LLG95_13995 [bacterium]|nr:hypothetical protein [bacterium]
MMQFITGSTRGRSFRLGGLPALIIGVLVASVAGMFVLAVSFFGILIWGIRRVLGRLLALFGAAETSPRVPSTSGETGNNTTIEMRRDTRGSWRKE